MNKNKEGNIDNSDLSANLEQLHSLIPGLSFFPSDNRLIHSVLATLEYKRQTLQKQIKLDEETNKKILTIVGKDIEQACEDYSNTDKYIGFLENVLYSRSLLSNNANIYWNDIGINRKNNKFSVKDRELLKKSIKQHIYFYCSAINFHSVINKTLTNLVTNEINWKNAPIKDISRNRMLFSKAIIYDKFAQLIQVIVCQSRELAVAEKSTRIASTIEMLDAASMCLSLIKFPDSQNGFSKIKSNRSNDFSDIAIKAIDNYLDNYDRTIKQIQPRHVLNHMRTNPVMIWGETINFPNKNTIAFSGGETTTALFRKRIKRQLDKLNDEK